MTWRLTLGLPGIFNVSDGKEHRIIDIADAMAANFSTDKRILSMPRGVVKWGLRLCPIPKLKNTVATLGHILQQGAGGSHRPATV